MNSTIATSPEQRTPAPGWAQSAFRSINYLVEDLCGGPRLVKLATAINFHKLFTFFIMDASISRHPGWTGYKARSGLLIP